MTGDGRWLCCLAAMFAGALLLAYAPVSVETTATDKSKQPELLTIDDEVSPIFFLHKAELTRLRGDLDGAIKIATDAEFEGRVRQYFDNYVKELKEKKAPAAAGEPK